MHHLIIFLFVLLLILANTIDSTEWDYGKHGPDVWKEMFSACAGKKQSPINIRTACTTYQAFEPFHFTSIYYEKIKFKLANNGHTITAIPNSPIIIPVTGGNLSGTYDFQNFHIHWGPNHKSGSEHQVNGDKYTGECHFVYNHKETGLRSVLSFFMRTKKNKRRTVCQRNNPRDVALEQQWQNFFDAAHQLTHENDSATIDLTLNLLMGSNLAEFWRYEGSLTTPKCDENVIWTVFRQPILVLDYDFENFRHDLFFESYRGPQPLYDRQVYRSFANEILSPIPDENCCPNRKSEAT